MSIVSAYTEIDRFSKRAGWGENPYVMGEYLDKTDSGLEVTWNGAEPPENAQVYLYWEPRVVAIWEEKKDESDGTEVKHAGPQDSEESDLGSGDAGGGVGEEPPTAGTDPA